MKIVMVLEPFMHYSERDINKQKITSESLNKDSGKSYSPSKKNLDHRISNAARNRVTIASDEEALL